MASFSSEAALRAELAGLRDALRPYDPRAAGRIDQALAWPDEAMRSFLMSAELWGGSGSLADSAGAGQPPEVQLQIRNAFIRLGESQLAHGFGNSGTVYWTQVMKEWRETYLRHSDRARFAVPWRPRDVWLGVASAVGIIVLAYAAALGLGSLSIEPNVDLWVALVPTLFELLFLVPVWWFTVRKYHASLASLGFVRFKPSTLAVGLGLLVSFYIFNGVYAYLLQGFGLRVQADPTPLLRELSSPWPLFVALVIVAPIAEETFFRGFVFAGLRSRYDWRLAAAISSALFAAAHLELTFFIPAFLLGYLFAFLYQRSNSIWPGMIVHALVNGIALAIAWSQA